MSAVLAAVLLVGCELPASMPDYPYDLPRADDAEVVHVDLVGAESGHIIDARLPGKNAFFKIHVADILAPAKGQPWNPEAVAALNALVKGKRACVRFIESLRGPDGVTVVGRVYVDGRDVSWELVGGGNAWVWQEISNDQALMDLQEWARRRGRGLWALPESDREPPWEFMDKQIRLLMEQREESPPN